MSNWWRTAVVGLRKTTDASRSYHSNHTIQAITREITGKRVSLKLRAKGLIPAAVLAQPNPRVADNGPVRCVSRKYLLTTERSQIQSILKSMELPYFLSTTFTLHIRTGWGSSTLLKSGNVLPIKVHKDRETGQLLNLVFVWADEGTPLKVDVPVEFKGEDVCPGLLKGGMLKKISTRLKCKCPSEHIPQKIEVDISNLDIGDMVFVRDVKVHPSLEFLSKNDSVHVCKIIAADL